MEEKMRRYEGENNVKLMRVVCNQCRKELKVENGYLKEGCFSADVTFGYFSQKDGTKHHFDLCEECYDKLVEQFAVPVEECQSTELM
jgi:ribosomal-protein-alanine N-acetyltransferase